VRDDFIELSSVILINSRVLSRNCGIKTLRAVEGGVASLRSPMYRGLPAQSVFSSFLPHRIQDDAKIFNFHSQLRESQPDKAIQKAKVNQGRALIHRNHQGSRVKGGFLIRKFFLTIFLL
jgi:hypothetical protein